MGGKESQEDLLTVAPSTNLPGQVLQLCRNRMWAAFGSYAAKLSLDE